MHRWPLACVTYKLRHLFGSATQYDLFQRVHGCKNTPHALVLPAACFSACPVHLKDPEAEPLGPLLSQQAQPSVEGSEHTRHPATRHSKEHEGPDLQ